MAAPTDNADYDAGDRFENVPSQLSAAGNYDNYYGTGLPTRCVLLSRPDNKTMLRQLGQPTSENICSTHIMVGQFNYHSFTTLNEIE
ncbi:unnamed protein product [Protopolystoma xenopodis]|uniref:Uncharacterized protein n=1 Tax=Protopolystoma xenopodis TaxID=117903 RepID=A0A448XGF9_9PLAT|nr:unnamed protein product [Protopolystoma xenopodis]